MWIGGIFIDGPMGICHFPGFRNVITRCGGNLIHGVARDALIGDNLFYLHLLLRDRRTRLLCPLGLARLATLARIGRRASSHDAARKRTSYKNNG